MRTTAPRARAAPPSPRASPQHLAVTNGCLASLPAEISQLSGLRELDLHKNELRALPPSLCAMSGLTVRRRGRGATQANAALLSPARCPCPRSGPPQESEPPCTSSLHPPAVPQPHGQPPDGAAPRLWRPGRPPEAGPQVKRARAAAAQLLGADQPGRAVHNRQPPHRAAAGCAAPLCAWRGAVLYARAPCSRLPPAQPAAASSGTPAQLCPARTHTHAQALARWPLS